jgi:Protein of unknown function (DUF1360)
MSDQAPDPRPTGGYAALMAVYSLVAGVLFWRLQARRQLPERFGAGDVVLFGVATHKVSRTITKDKVTAPLRSPFAEEDDGEGGPGEVSESPRGEGLRRAVGELLICPYCVGQWVATGLLGMFSLAPRAARFVAAVFTVVAISDFLQIAYRASEEKL